MGADTPRLTGTAPRPHVTWLVLWAGSMTLLWVWDVLFLNRPALVLIQTAFFHSLVGGVCVVGFSFILGWLSALARHQAEHHGGALLSFMLVFTLDLLRSVPQIVGILLGYVLLTSLILTDALRTPLLQIVSMAGIISIFVFLEVADLIRERIAHYQKLDFVDAMLCCGISEHRIINREILLKNCMAHLVHKAVALFGTAIFLQCSIDFIVSVGLSTEVASTNFPVTLGGLLARMDSKQDILAIGMALAHPAYLPALFFRHLQGLSTAFAIVVTLLCTYQIANGLVRRYRL